MVAEQPRVGVVCDLVEEGWPSMDLVADMLLACLQREFAHHITAERIRPLMRRRATLWGGDDRYSPAASRMRRFLFNADRLANRFWDYPRYVRGLRNDFDAFHVVDHSYAQLVHVLPPERTIVTCHDIEAFRVLLQPPHGPRSGLFRAMAERTLSGLVKAAWVTCDSAAVRDEILTHGLLPPERLVVAPIGVHPTCKPEPDREADAVVEHLLGPPTADTIDLLHVGSTIPRKRIDLLIRIFAAVRDQFPRARLIRVGGVFTPPQAELVERLELAGSVVVLPGLDRNVLAAVYRRATLVLQPSEAEGFGLPVVEALACGTPVVASDIPVLREVGGGGANYCPVADVGAWTEAIAGMLMERGQTPEQWAARRAAGIAHAGRYSWAGYSRKMVSLYEQVLDS